MGLGSNEAVITAEEATREHYAAIIAIEAAHFVAARDKTRELAVRDAASTL